MLKCYINNVNSNRCHAINVGCLTNLLDALVCTQKMRFNVNPNIIARHLQKKKKKLPLEISYEMTVYV